MTDAVAELASEGQEEAQPEAPTEPKAQDKDLTVEPPAGAEFSLEEVKTDRGSSTLGNQPILVWKLLDAALEHFGEEKLLASLDGTSLRVSYQGIARRFAKEAKSFDDIAQAQINFKPGTRAGGQSTPVSRAAKAARSAAETAGDSVTALLEKIASGEISADAVASLVGTQDEDE